MDQDTYDFDYAHTLLVECVSQDPSNHVYVDAFLGNLQRKYKNNKRGAVLHFGGKGSLKKAVSRESWREVLRLGPEVLKTNPWDLQTLRGMAAACGALGYHEVELRYLRNALEAKPKDADLNRHCANSLARVGLFDHAILCWQRVDEALEGDREAQEAVADLQIAKTQGRKGISTAQQRAERSAAKPKAEPHFADRDEPGESRQQIPLTPRQQLEQALVLNPSDIDSCFRLVELHVANDRLGEAVLVLTKVLAASGNDIRVQERLEDIEILRKRQQLQIAERRALEAKSSDRQTLAEQLRDDVNRYEVEVYDRRSQRYPEDLELKFQLGVRLKRAGNLRSAMEFLEQGSKLSQRSASGALELGECLQRLKKYSDSLEHYGRAADLSRQSREPEIEKLAAYRAGILAAGLGNDRAAEEWFSRLVELEPDYRDAASRLDRIRNMRHKG